MRWNGRRDHDVATLSLFPEAALIPKRAPTRRIEKFNFLDPEAVQVREYGALAAEIIRDGSSYGLILATGLGKTFIAFLVMDYCLTKGKVVFLAPTTSLCVQHRDKARESFNGIERDEINVVTGDTPTKKRAEIYAKSRIIIGTPQTFLGDLNDDFDRPVTLDGVSLIIFDEMHFAAKRYAYVPLAAMAQVRDIQRLGLTASPGGTKEKIARIKGNLHLDHWLRFSLEDDEIKRFRYPRSEEVIKIPLGDELMVMRDGLLDMMRDAHTRLVELGYVNDPFPIVSENRLLGIRATIDASLAIADEEQKYEVWKAISQHATYYKLHKALVFLLTESYLRFTLFGAKLMKQADAGTKASARIIGDPRYLTIWNKAQNLVDKGILHPKQEKFLEIVRGRDAKETMLVFCDDTESNRELVKLLGGAGISAVAYTGKSQMPTKKQLQTKTAFEAGLYAAMVATPAGDLGLDMKVDVVIDYSVPKTGEVMTQRHGRCARHKVGYVFTLLMDDESDLHHYYAARSHKRIMALESEPESRGLKLSVLTTGLPRYPISHLSLFSGKPGKAEFWVKDIKPGQTAHERFKIVRALAKSGRKRGPFVYFRIADKTGVMMLFHPAKDIVQAQALATHFRSGRICIVCAEAKDWKGTTVLAVDIRQDQFMVLCPEEDSDPADYVEPKQKPLDPNF